jgi:DNA adenine methylase
LTPRRRPQRAARTRNATPTPFVKWAGGKTQLLAQYQAHIPQEIRGQYIEPFVGGGALFFWLRKHGALKGPVVLNDLNKELMNCHVAIRDDVEAVIEALRAHEEHKQSRAHFYRVRKWDRAPDFHSQHDEVERAARTIYLNHTCYNGLYRVNSRGEFNVPFGKYKNPRVLDEENLRAVSQALQGVELRNQDFAMVLDWAKPGDFVYFDPPYLPLSETSNFTSYTRESFDFRDQERLAEVFRALAKRGCLVALSNSHTEAVQQLYEGFRQETVQATRAISSKGDGRGAIPELLILSY